MHRPSLAPLNDRLVGWRDLTVWQTRPGQMAATSATRLAAVLGPHLALLISLGTAFTFLALLSGASAEIYDQVEDGQGLAGFDRPVLDAALRLRSPTTDRVVTVYTDLGGPVIMPLLAAGAVLCMTVAWRQWTPAALMVVAAAGSLLMTSIGKAAVGRPRPPLTDAVPPYENSGSFPSGHTLNAVVVAGVLAYLLLRRQRRAWVRAGTVAAAATFAAAMGLSRVFLGHHWLTDVLVAWTLGLAWLTIVIFGHRLLLTIARRHRPAG